MKVKYPLASVIPYGPDHKTVTKLAVGIMPSPRHKNVSVLKRWGGTTVATDEHVAREIYAFMREHGVKTVLTATRILGCPHEEGEDFPSGADCPFCPFWKGRQGSAATHSVWDGMRTVQTERLGSSYTFRLP